LVMDVLSALHARRSAKKLIEPAPTREHLEVILRAGANAPDHGRLRPWHFFVLQGAARLPLGELMAQLLLAKMPQASPEQLAAERSKVMRAPTIIAVAAKVTANKIPPVEQVLSAGAAVENMFLAAAALGYGAMWKTGDAAYSPEIKAYLGLAPEDHIVAFLYIGTAAATALATPVSLEGLVTWM
jgi:nitroreductase